MAIAWPSGVRTKIRVDDYDPSPPQNLTESPMERGQKLRVVATGTPEIHKCSLRLPTSELSLLEAWIAPSGANPYGAQRFTFPHPRTGIDHECQFVPQDRKAFDYTPAPGKNWFVKIDLRIYPN